MLPKDYPEFLLESYPDLAEWNAVHGKKWSGGKTSVTPQEPCSLATTGAKSRNCSARKLHSLMSQRRRRCCNCSTTSSTHGVLHSGRDPHHASLASGQVQHPATPSLEIQRNRALHRLGEAGKFLNPVILTVEGKSSRCQRAPQHRPSRSPTAGNPTPSSRRPAPSAAGHLE